MHQQKHNCSTTPSFKFDGSHLKEGVYLYRIYNQDHVFNGKMIKQ